MSDKLPSILEDLDLRFVSIQHDFQTFGYMIEALRAQIPSIIEKEKELVSEKIKGSDDDSDIEGLFRSIYERMFEDFIDIDIPRFFYCPLLLILYAICESAMMEIAEEIQKGQKCKLAITDIRGDLLEQNKKYYKHVLHFDLFQNDLSWQRLKMLQVLRHAIAHANGRWEMIDNSKRKKILGWVKHNVGIGVYNNLVVVTEDFLMETYSILRSAIQDLTDRVKTNYPTSKKEVEDNA